MSSLIFNGLLGLHIVLALIWIAATFISLRSLLKLSKDPRNLSSAKRARMSQMLIAAAGGLTVLIGAGFYYYINFYRTAYATSKTGLPLVDAGAVLGIIVFAWQMAMGSRIRNSLKAIISAPATSGSTTTTPVQTISSLPKSWMLIAPAILLVLAFLLMIGGSMM
jgi:hypothetical protein